MKVLKGKGFTLGESELIYQRERVSWNYDQAMMEKVVAADDQNRDCSNAWCICGQ